MATDQEKTELVETLKGPHFYRVTVWGYGGESSYMRIPKEAHDYWNKVTDEHGDGPLINYIIGADEKTAEEVDIDMFEDYEDEMADFMPVPDEAKFMHDVDDTESVGYTWYEPKDEIEHVWGVASDNARVTIDKIDSNEYGAKHLEDIVDGEELYELINRLDEEVDYETEHNDCLETDCNRPSKGDFVCHMYSSEKGTFFEAILETPGLIDLQKLKFIIDEAPNGEDTLWAIKYDGEELDNEGGDTNGKGYYASVYEQEW
jgi:hypothetical protein